ncbi:MAG: phosphoenolpyruvate carboxylase [Moraxellaceae bacterium]|nr:phosphoenolpyruvate carboxylase [Moraxellaceae bacterium]
MTLNSDLGTVLRARLQKTVGVLLNVVQRQQLLELTPVLKRSMTVRTPYILPLHILQAELMKRRARTLCRKHRV